MAVFSTWLQLHQEKVPYHYNFLFEHLKARYIYYE